MKTLALAIVLAIAGTASAQTPRHLTFDVASIRPSDPTAQGGQVKPIPGGHGYTMRNVPIKLVMALMYRVPQRQIEGGPDWFNNQSFDIEARVDGTYSVEDLHTMFQNLLADRFGLKFHKDIRDGNIYALTVDPSGLKMKPNTTPEDFEIPMQGPPNKVVGKRVSLPYLCWNLGQALQNDARPCHRPNRPHWLLRLHARLPAAVSARLRYQPDPTRVQRFAVTLRRRQAAARPPPHRTERRRRAPRHRPHRQAQRQLVLTLLPAPSPDAP